MTCCFSTSIADELSCSPNGMFDDYGFPLVKCENFPCDKYKETRQHIIEDEKLHAHTRVKGTLFQYYCPDCGYQRDGLLDDPMYSWSCPKCGLGHCRNKEVSNNT